MEIGADLEPKVMARFGEWAEILQGSGSTQPKQIVEIMPGAEIGPNNCGQAQ